MSLLLLFIPPSRWTVTPPLSGTWAETSLGVFGGTVFDGAVFDSLGLTTWAVSSPPAGTWASINAVGVFSPAVFDPAVFNSTDSNSNWVVSPVNTGTWSISA